MTTEDREDDVDDVTRKQVVLAAVALLAWLLGGAWLWGGPAGVTAALGLLTALTAVAGAVARRGSPP